MQIFEALEIAENGKGTGHYRLTVRSTEPPTLPVGLCHHRHATIAEAEQCLEALAMLEPEFSPPVESLVAHVEHLRARLWEAEAELARSTRSLVTPADAV